MGQKKRNSTSRNPASFLTGGQVVTSENAGSPDVEQSSGDGGKAAGESSNIATPVANGGVVGDGAKGGDEVATVKGDCEKALVALRRGNSTKALKLIRDACNRNDNNALVHRVHGHICMRLASMIEDPTTKQRHLKEAIEAARKAVSLSSQSVEYAHFHAQLLFEAATDGKGYEEVVRECERALSIEDPVDPAKESLHEEGQHKPATPEARIAQVQQELRGLVQKANIASISTWMKTLGNGSGEEKLRFIQMRKLTEDPMEQRILQPKRPNEVKKSVKTPEERRKEIEVRVAAARLLQHRGESSPPQSEDVSTVSAKGSQRSEKRKPNGLTSRRLSHKLTPEERVEHLKPFWNAAGAQRREVMLEVPKEELQVYVGSSKSNLATEAVSEALNFAQEKKTWRFWTCCQCSERFTDSQEHSQHVMQEHIDSLTPELQRVLPQEIDQDWADQLRDEDCKPFDGPAAIKLLIESSNAVILEESTQEPFCSSMNPTGFDCSSDVSDNSMSSRESCLDPLIDPLYHTLTNADEDANVDEDVNLTGTSFSIVTLDVDGEQNTDRNNPHVCNGDCHRSKTVQRLVREIPSQDLPRADDEERTKILERIYNLFRLLMRNKCLAADHVVKVVQYAIEELQNLVPDTTVHYEFNHSPLYIRFLPAYQLRSIHKYLCELAHTCGLDRLTEPSNSPDNAENGEDDLIQDRLFLNDDLTMLVLDERLLREIPRKSMETQGNANGDISSGRKQVPTKEIDAVGPGPQPLPLMKVKDGESVSHADLQLSWIYGKADYEYQPTGWNQFREERARQGRELFRAVEKEFLSLQNLCERKREHISREEAINVAERLCIEEMKKREHKGDGSCRSYEVVLKRRQRELFEDHANGLTSQRKLEHEVITTILRDAQSVNMPRFSYDGTSLSLNPSRLSDSDDDEDDAWRIQEFVHRTDSCIEVAIQRQKDHFSTEVNKLDARIMKAMETMQRLERNLGSVSVLDYRAVVLPLVKSFLKARLEDAAGKDALQKSDAAREAFLAELARDEKPVLNKGPELSKLSREKLKDRKKGKDPKKLKDAQHGVDVGYEILQTNEMESVVVENEVADGLEDEDILGWDDTEESRQQHEAELMRRAELEAEERKLAETLELQRRVEEETKQKHLAELRRRQAQEEKHFAEFKLQQEEEVENLVEQRNKRIEEESKGYSFIMGKSLCMGDNASSLQNKNNGSCVENLSPDQLPLSNTWSSVGVSVELYSKLGRLSVEESPDEGSIRTTGNTNFAISEIGRSLSSPPAQFHVRVPVEEKGHAESPEVAKKSPRCFPVKTQIEPVLDVEKSTRIVTSMPDAGQQILSPNKTKKGGRRRRKLAQPLEDRFTGMCREDQDTRLFSSNSNGSTLQDSQGRASPACHVNGASIRPVEDDCNVPSMAQSMHRSNAGLASSASMWKRKQNKGENGVVLPLDNAKGIRENGSKTLRQLKNEQDDEDRFQADLERAMRQSLDMLQLESNVGYPPDNKEGFMEASPIEVQTQNALSIIESQRMGSEVEEVGKGLQNETGQYNCFLNVVIQSLWHLRKFREELLAATSIHHTHVGHPCVVCALRGIFVSLSTQPTQKIKEAIAPTALRVALSTRYLESDCFQEAQMNDASEVLLVIFDCLHEAFALSSVPSDADSDTSNGYGSWDCHDSSSCLVHNLFGLDIAQQMNCRGCGLESRQLKYTSFFHNINASALRTAKIMYQESPLDELLKLVDMNDHFACDMEKGGCGRQNYIHHLLRAAPHVFTTVLGWQNNQESEEDISATVDAIETDMDVGVVYRGLDEGNKHRLVSVVCYYGQHYHCFAFKNEIGRWVMFDDTNVKVVGDWEDVADTCRRGHLQPQVLFYEAVSTY